MLIVMNSFCCCFECFLCKSLAINPGNGKAFSAASCDCRLLYFLERFKYAWQIAYQLWNTRRFAFFWFSLQKNTYIQNMRYMSEGRNSRENKENVYGLIFLCFCEHKLTFKFMVSWSPTFSYSPAVQVPTASRNTIIKSQVNEPKSNG